MIVGGARGVGRFAVTTPHFLYISLIPRRSGDERNATERNDDRTTSAEEAEEGGDDEARSATYVFFSLAASEASR